VIDGATMPTEREIPPSLALLAYRNALPLRSGRDFDRDVADIGTTIAGYIPPVSPLTLAGQGDAAHRGDTTSALVALVTPVVAVLVGGGYVGYPQFLAPATPLIASPPTLDFPCFGTSTESGGVTVVTLDSPAGSSAVDGSVRSVSQAGGGDWATATPSSGTIPAGVTETIILTPNPQIWQGILVQDLLIYIAHITHIAHIAHIAQSPTSIRGRAPARRSCWRRLALAALFRAASRRRGPGFSDPPPGLTSRDRAAWVATRRRILV
jgi:hypothetical protein